MRELEVFEQCIRKGIEFDEIADQLRRGEKVALTQQTAAGRIRLLRLEAKSAESGISFWTSLTAGDRVVHVLQTGEVTEAVILGKIINEGVAEKIGNLNAQNDLGLIAVLGKPSSSYTATEILARFSGGPETEGEEFVQIPADVFDDVMSVSSALENSVAPTVIAAVDADWDQLLDASDRYTNQIHRPEQQLLRKLLFGGKQESSCALCGKDFPIDFLVTAHIKKRSLAVHEERIDKSIVMPVCLFGCDELFERGLVSVSGDGEFLIHDRPMFTPAIIAYTKENFAGKRCWWWDRNPSSRKYFAFHHENVASESNA
jgi:hypothetical protein